jgi:DNA-binding GntR family transcriptional regulator
MDASAQPLINNLVSRLEALILSGKLPPGAPLREHALAKTLDVSRGPLREAIRTLEGRRLLQRIPNAGVRVIELSVEDLEQLLGMREALEGMACRQAAENMTAAEVRRLREIASSIEKRQREDEDGAFALGGDRDFHRQIAIGSRNRWITRLLCDDLYSLLLLYRTKGVVRSAAAARQTHHEHCEIIDCIHARDADGAEAAMRRHLRNGRTRLLARIKQGRNAERRSTPYPPESFIQSR